MANNQPPPIKYTFDADARKFAQGAKKVEQDLKGIDRQAKDTDKALDFDVKVDDSALGTLRRRLLETKSALEHDIQADVDIDPSEALRNLRRIEGQLRALDRMDVRPEVKVDVDRNIGGIMSTLTGSMSKMAPAASGLAGSLPVVGSSLAAMGPAGIAAAAGIAAVAAATAAAVGPGLLGAGISAPILLAGKGLLEAYDTIDKANRKAKIVFGGNLKEVQKWARGLSTNVGLGEKEIIAASSAIQDLLVPQGFKRSDAAAITEAVYERGAALAEFSGVDTVQGVEAVTAALLGSRKQLKGLGVDITASEVKQKVALLKGEASFKGYSDKMLNTAATLELLKEKSGDAWTAFNEGGSAADTVLDTLNATIANLKTDAIEGFGGILTGIISDLMAVGNVDLGGLTDLSGWIKENKNEIRAFFLDLGILAGKAAISALDLGISVTTMMTQSAPLVANYIRMWGDIAATLQRAAGFALMVSPATFLVGKRMIDSASSTSALADAAADTYENMTKAFGPSVLSGLQTARGAVADVTTSMENLQAVDAVMIAIKPLIKEGDTDAVRAELRTLSADQLAVLIATIDPESATKTEKEMLRLAKKRLAHVEAVAATKAAQDKLDALGGSSTHTVFVKVKGYNVPKYLLRPGLTADAQSMAVPAPQFSRSAAARSIAPMAAGPGDTSSTIAVSPDRAGVFNYAPVINSYYPKPERTSDTIAMQLRLARYGAYEGG